MIDDNMFFIGEWFSGLEKSLTSWSYGLCNRGEHVTVKADSYFEFIEELIGVSKDYSIIDEDGQKQLNSILKAINSFNEMSYDNKKYDDLEGYIESSIKEWEYEVINLINQCLDYTQDDILEYFLEYDFESFEDCYIEGDSLELKEDISYIKSWA